MDFTKFLSLLETNQLFFARADSFEDPYEGMLSKASVSLLRNPELNGNLPPQAAEQLLAFTDMHRKNMFYSCWVSTEHESAAMWKLYLQSPEGIAIISDHDSLLSQLDKSDIKIRTTLVKYIDYDNTLIPIDNIFFPFLHKRKSFEHENELRAMIWSDEDTNKSLIDKDASYVAINIDVSALIKAVHVSPTAPKWFGELVEKILQRYKLNIPVERSGLYERPSY